MNNIIKGIWIVVLMILVGSLSLAVRADTVRNAYIDSGDIYAVPGSKKVYKNLVAFGSYTGYFTFTNISTGGVDYTNGLVTWALANITSPANYLVEFVDSGSVKHTFIFDYAYDDPTLAEINGTVDTALLDYDGPTDAEMLAAHSATDALINGIDDNPWDNGTRTLTVADWVTSAAMIAQFNNLSTTNRSQFERMSSIVGNVNVDVDETGLATSTDMRRMLGLAQHNQYIDTASFDGYGHMTAWRTRIYSNATSVGTNSNVYAVYSGTATFSGANMTNFKMKFVR